MLLQGGKYYFNNSLFSGKSTRIVVNYFCFILLLPLFTFSINLSAQTKISKDNYSGNFTDNNSWLDSSAPNPVNVSNPVIIYGDIQHTGNISFNQALDIYDSLSITGNVTLGNDCNPIVRSGGIFTIQGNLDPVNKSNLTIESGAFFTIYGDLTMGNQGNLIIESGGIFIIHGDLALGNQGSLTIEPGAIFIVYGNYTSDNKTNVLVEGTMIVTGTFTQNGGSNNQGSFEINGGNVYILDPVPQIKQGSNYDDLRCNPDCGYGGMDDLKNDPVWGLFSGITYDISASGPTEFCEGDSVILSVPDSSTWYQWYKDAVIIPGADSFSFTALESGDYHIRILTSAFPDTIDIGPVNVTVKENSIAPVSASVDPDTICAGSGNIELSYEGGSPGTGGTARWYSDPGFTNLLGTGNNLIIPAPAVSQTYYVRFEDHCGYTDARSVNVTVRDLPVVVFTAPGPVCIDGADITLSSGSPAGGTYSGPGIIDDTFHPEIAGEGTHTLTYSYTDGNGCSNSAEQDIRVIPIPIVSFSGLAPYIAITDPPILLNASPEGGTFSGPGIIGDTFHPEIAGLGLHEIVYEYTEESVCTNSDTLYTEVLDYDFMHGAITLTDFDNWYSGDAVYSTIGATADGNVASCWNQGNNHTRWFKFQAATEQIKLTFLTGGSYGTARRINAAIWEADGTTEVNCYRYIVDYDSVVVQSPNLTPGNWYYVSITTATGAYRGSFSLRVNGQVDYDYYEGAIELTDFDNWYSGDAIYSTRGATADGNVASCWNQGNSHTRWFKFQAATEQIALTFLTGGLYGTARRINAAIWEADGTTEVNCNRYISDYDSVVVQSPNLTPGNWYYVSITTATGGYYGSFSLRVNGKVDYDYYEGAIELTDLNNWSSPDAIYTTRGASADKSAAPCWNTSPNYNRWFKFTATTNTISILVRGGNTTYGTLQRINAAIWEDDGSTIVSCNRYISDNDDVYVESVDLVPGNVYYLSVDNNYEGFRGSFSLNIDTRVTYDYKEGAYELQDLTSWCSVDAAFSTRGATPDLNAASCWNTGPNYNRWFKFVASTPVINIKVKTNGSYGTIRRINLALWEDDGITQIACNRYVSDSDSVSIGTSQLLPGNTYYISVDNNYEGFRGTFTLCIDNQLNYDYLEGAKDITYLINNCSENAEYTTVGATPDRTAPHCWNTSPNYNRWFKFMATTSSINIQLKTGSPYGTIRRAQLALYDQDSTTVLDCNRYVNDEDNIEVSAGNLIPGKWYFIAVDNNFEGFRGTFSLCLDDKPNYDFYEGAIELGIIHDWHSSNAAYTTIGATPDKSAASCWNTGPNYNRWFKFTATTNQIHIEIRTGGVYGTIRRVNAAIWEADGLTEVACKRYVNDNDIVEVEALNLIPGNTYYLSVDNNYAGFRGTFSLYINDAVDYDFYEGARDVSHLINSQSLLQEYTTIGASPDRNPGTCWNTAPNYNRWFKFRATTPGINIKVLTGGSYGSIRRVNIALFESDGITQLSCNRYVTDFDIVELDYEGLAPGNWYYFSVDNNNMSFRGSFTLALNDEVSYDYYEGAIELIDLHNWSSPDAAYTTSGATPDKIAASCWNTAPNFNRWFKFTATTPVINIEVRTGGNYGTIRRINAALWEADGITEVTCKQYVNENDNVSLGANTLTPGNTYYISVDNNNPSYRGTFSLYIDDAMDYDFYEGAYEITKLNNWQSELQEFTTVGATPDKIAGSCWNAGPYYNRWFKFQAIHSDVSIQVLRGGPFGTISRIYLALWDSDGTTELSCKRYSAQPDNVSIAYSGLNPGNWYYISVDNNLSARGTFTLQVNNISGNEYYAIANGNWNIASTWSLSEGGPPATSAPQIGDVVHIKGYNVIVNTDEACAELNIEAINNNTSLTLNGGSLAVNGEMTFSNNAYNVSGEISILNSGSLSINDDFNINRAGGNNIFRITVQDNSSISVQNDLIIKSSSGNINNTELNISGTAEVRIMNDLILENTGGIKSSIILNNSANLRVHRDILFSSPAQNRLEIQLNNDSKLFAGRSVQRGATRYGILNSRDNSTIVFNSSDYLQIIPENAGGGTDNFSYRNIEINNTRISSPQLSLEGPVSVSGTLTLTRGIIKTTTTKLLNIESSGTISGGSALSYIEGPLKITGNLAVSFPLGKNGRYLPLAISAPNSVNDAFIAEYFGSNPNPYYNINLHEASIDHVSNCEYWTLERVSGNSAINVNIAWDGNCSCISDLANLKVAVWDGSEWKNYGNGNINGSIASGEITSSDAINLNSCAITFADFLPFVDFTDPGGPYCKTGSSILLSGFPEDSNGWFTGNGIINNGDGTAFFDPGITNPGSHQITYNYTSASGCSNSISKYITVNANPTATIIGGGTVCAGVEVEFSIYLTGAPPWNITYTDGADLFNITTSANPYKFKTSTPGIYSVTAVTDNNGCTGSVLGSSADLLNWPVIDKPLVSILSGTSTFCEGSNVVLTTPDANLYYWSNGVSTQNDTIVSPGNYWVRVVDEHGCFSGNSDTITVSVIKTARKPSAISGNIALCQNSPNTSYSTSSWYADVYNWSLEPSITGTIIGTASNITIDWDENYSGIAKLTVYGSNSDCGAGPVSDTLYITLNALPEEPGLISGPQTVCQGQTGLIYSIDPVPNTTGYIWSLPENTVISGPSNGNSITVNFLNNAVSGKISVQAYNACGSSLNISSLSIDVQTLSIAATGINLNTDSICPGDSVILSVEGGFPGSGASWKWYLDDLCTIPAGPEGLTLTVNPVVNTSYWLRAEGLCNNTATVSATVNMKEAPVQADAVNVDRPSVCSAEGTIVLSYSGGSPGTGGVARWYSDPGLTNFIGSGNNLNLSAPAATQTYYMRFEADCGNSSVRSVSLTVFDPPTVTFDTINPVGLYSGDFILNQGNPGGGIYSGNGIIAGNTFNPSLAGAGTHTLTYTYTDGNGCANSANRDILVYALDIPVITGATDVCLMNAEVFSTSEDPGYSYSWTVNGGTIISGAGTHEITVEFTNPGNADISVTITKDAFSETSDVYDVTVYDLHTLPDIESDNKLNRR